MKRYGEVLLEVWREACRHIEIQESTGNIAALLPRYLPLEELVVRRVDRPERCVETVAVGRPRGQSVPARQATQLTSRGLRKLTQWLTRGEPFCGKTPIKEVMHEVVPPEMEGEIAAVGLCSTDGPIGALVIAARPRASFESKHLQLLSALAEPFAVALENDRRLHELAALREAAEAERRTLLSRLGRDESVDPIIGADTGLRHVMERVNLVAESDVPVLILGETGTGKEVVARAIHSRSIRASGPFIRVNCGAIPTELIDSQLFGHEKGSFTGAAELRRGWFERADGGTLFLDEIGELPLAAQVRLLRVLQDGFIERVGGQHSLQVNVRIVAATHRDLANMVKHSQFREDLWYRVNIFPILLPRLRERMEDIPALARHFALRAAHRFGLPGVEPSELELQVLKSYSWPGNIRELAAVLDRAAILGNGKRLDVKNALGIAIAPREPSETEVADADHGMVPTRVASPTTLCTITPLADAMRNHIERALTICRGRVEGAGGAAQLLDINPHTLRARMRKLRIDWGQFRAP